jgi:predicted  nucleic acid-binding Zn-ribbon protein
VLKLPAHECLHEEKILGQSRAIERINAELDYKKEKLDDLKRSNERMEEKIDDIKDCINQLIVKSNSNDSALEARLVAIETKQADLEAKVDENKKDNDSKTNQTYVRIGLIVSGISVAIGLLFHFI